MATEGWTKVEVQPDFSGFNSALRRGLDRAMSSASSSITRAFKPIEESARKTGEQVSSSFKKAGETLDRSIKIRDAKGRFAPLDRAALASSDTLIRSFRKADDSFERSSNNMKRSGEGVRHTLRNILLAAGGFYLIERVAGALRDVAAAGQESLRVGRVTEQLIRATGGAANVTSAQMDKLSTKISVNAGIDDELVKSAGNVLLTFRQVQNQVGKGNDIFNRAISDAADLSAVLGTDLRSSTLQLGKALADPIRGITALRRAGVNFTQQQKDQIKTLVDSGQTLEAQKLILGEVEHQVGGAAKAAADPMDRLKVAADNLKEALGAGLLGAIDPLVTRFSGLAVGLEGPMKLLGSSIGQAFSSFGPALADIGKTLVPTLQPLTLLAGQLIAAFAGPLASAFRALGPVVTALAGPLGVLARVIGSGLSAAIDAVAPLLLTLAEILSPIIGRLASGLASFIAQAAPGFLKLGQALGSALDKIGPALNDALGKTLPVLADALVKLLPSLAQVAAILAQDFADAIVAIAPALPAVATALGAVATALARIPPPILAKLIEAFIVMKGAQAAQRNISLAADGMRAFTSALRGAGIEEALGSRLAQAYAKDTATLGTRGLEAGGQLNKLGTALAGIGSKGVSGIKAAGSGLSSLASSAGEALAPLLANPVTLVILGIVALGAALFVAYKKFKPFHDAVDATGRFLRDKLLPAIVDISKAVASFFVNAWQSAVRVFGPVVSALFRVYEAFGKFLIEPIRTVVRVVNDLIHGRFMAAFREIGTFPVRMLALLGSALGKLPRLFGAVFNLIAGVWSQLGPFLLRVLLGAVQLAVRGVVAYWTTVPALLLKGLAALPGLLAGLFVAVWGTVLRLTVAGVQNLIAFVVSLPFRMLNAVLTLADLFYPFMVRLWIHIGELTLQGILALVGLVASLPSRARAAIAALLPLIASFLQSAWARFSGIVVNGVNSVVSLIASLPGRAWAALQRLPGLLASALRNALSAALSAARTGVSNVVSAIAGLPGRIGDLVPRILSAAARIGRAVVDGIKNGVARAVSVAGDIAKGVGRALLNVINGLIDKINTAIPDKIGKGLLSLPLPHNPIPHIGLAEGGFVNAPMLAMMGEAGRELVLPLSDRARSRQLLEQAGLAGGGAVQLSIAPGAFQVQVVVQGTFDPATARRVGAEVGEAAARVLAKQKIDVAARTA